MKVIIAHDPLPKSIMLLGPTPRDKNVPSWRPGAIRILNDIETKMQISDFDITIYTPTDLEGYLFGDKTKQRRWEWEAMSIATVLAFWIPRDLQVLPGFTSNVEFGLNLCSDKMIVGFPKDSPKNSYLEDLAHRYKLPVYHTLEATMEAAMAKLLLPYGGS